MKTIMKQASFWQNKHVEPFYQSPVVSDEEEHRIHQIHTTMWPLATKVIGGIGGGIAGGYAAHKSGQNVFMGAATGAGAGALFGTGVGDFAGNYLRNKKIINKRKLEGRPVFGALEKAHYSQNKPAPAIPIKNIKITGFSESFKNHMPGKSPSASPSPASQKYRIKNNK